MLGRCHLFLRPDQLFCSGGKDSSHVTSEFAKALSAVLEAHTTFSDLNDLRKSRSLVTSPLSLSSWLLMSILKSSTPEWTEMLFWCLAFCCEEVIPLKPVGKCRLLGALGSTTARWGWWKALLKFAARVSTPAGNICVWDQDLNKYFSLQLYWPPHELWPEALSTMWKNRVQDLSWPLISLWSWYIT